MSNPYIGYGPKFLYVISRIVLILLLIPLFSIAHSQVKKLSSSVFFTHEGDILKDRFDYARTLYGLFVIFSFLFFAILGFVIASNILGYPISLSSVSNWLHTPLYSMPNPISGGKRLVTIIDISRVFIYFIMGILFAYFVNNVVLGKIFDLLLVNIGIQNAILALTKYGIIIAAIVISLQSLGLGSVLFYFFAIVTALGFAIKDIISDFMAYFIILVQRPIKIGDFVKIDPDLMGVVRHITLRSTIIRTKSSTTLIVPNSQVMVNPVVNWNYSRTFFSFGDIYVTVPYAADPQKVKELIFEVLDSNINILKNPAPVVRLEDFVENGYQFIIRGSLSPDKVADQFDIASDIRLELVRVLRQNSITIASPTRIVMMQREPNQ